MPIISTNASSSSGNLISVIAANQMLTILPNVTLTTTFGWNVIFGENTSSGLGIDNFGLLVGDSSITIQLFAGGRIYNGEDALIASLNSAAIYADGAATSVINVGTISGAIGASLFFNRSSVTNDGSIVGKQYGVDMFGTENQVINTGLIAATTPELGNAAAIRQLSGSGTIINSGTVDGGTNVTNARGILAESASLTVINTGLIEGARAGIELIASGSLTLVNEGTIQGQTGIIGVSSSSLAFCNIVNTGLIAGGVSLGIGNDFLDNVGGDIIGAVTDAGGNDVYRLDGDIGLNDLGGTDAIEATISFSLDAYGQIENLTLLGTAAAGVGNTLANVITGNVANNQLAGADGNDTLNGQSGNDTLDGGAGLDLISGGEGDDNLRGRSGQDTINGEAGEDNLRGGVFSDQLSGGDGDDTLAGGGSRDALNGGADADTFVYRALSDSTAVDSTRDVITGFERGLDVIDLSALDASSTAAGNQAFTFIGTATFSNVAGQLRYLLSGPDLFIEADVNGDSLADFGIRLNALAVLGSSDLVL